MNFSIQWWGMPKKSHARRSKNNLSAGYVSGLRVETLEERRLLAVAALGNPALVGTETGVNCVAQVASDDSGDYVVAWTNEGNLYARLFDASGTAKGAALLVASTGSVSNFAVAMNGAGEFVAVWNSAGGFLAQRFHANGAANGAAFQVTAHLKHGQASVGLDDAGRIAIGYNSFFGAVVQHIGVDNSAGALTVLSAPPGMTVVWSPRLAMTRGGDCLVTFGGHVFDQNYQLVEKYFAQVVGAGGASKSLPIEVAGLTFGMDSAGNFLVAAAGSSNVFHRYDAAGNLVETITADGPGGIVSAIVLDDDGSFTVAWVQKVSGQDATLVQQFASDGVAKGAAVAVSEPGAANSQVRGVARDGSGDFVLLWRVAVGADGELHAQRFAPEHSVMQLHRKVHEILKDTDAENLAEALSLSTTEHQESLVRAVYEAVLGREVDATGHAYWTARLQSGATMDELVAELTASEEYFSNTGGSHDAWLAAIYRDLMGREIDAAGLAHWRAVLAVSGRGSVVTGIMQSNEYRAAMIDSYFMSYLNRTADDAGKDFWLKAMNHGCGAAEVVQAILASPEYSNCKS